MNPQNNLPAGFAIIQQAASQAQMDAFGQAVRAPGNWVPYPVVLGSPTLVHAEIYVEWINSIIAAQPLPAEGESTVFPWNHFEFRADGERSVSIRCNRPG